MESTPQRQLKRELKCPSCGSRLCVRVDHQGWADTLYQWLGKFPWCCRHCGTRFYLNAQSVSVRKQLTVAGAGEMTATK